MILFVLGVLGLGMSLYAALPDPTSDFSAFVKWLFDAIVQRDWKFVAAGAIIGVLALAKTFGAKRFPFLTKGKYVWLVAVVGSALMGLATGLAAEKVHTFTEGLSAFLAGAFVGAGATGLHKGAAEWFGKSPTPPPGA